MTAEESKQPVDEMGFLPKERSAHDALMACMKEFCELPVEHPSDLHDFINAVHAIQHILGMRVVRRAFPEGWYVEKHP